MEWASLRRLRSILDLPLKAGQTHSLMPWRSLVPSGGLEAQITTHETSENGSALVFGGGGGQDSSQWLQSTNPPNNLLGQQDFGTSSTGTVWASSGGFGVGLNVVGRAAVLRQTLRTVWRGMV